MSYFSEVNDYRTYTGKEDDFHFIYNANTGGGQSFLGGKFRDPNGSLVSPTSLNGRLGVFRFTVGEASGQHDVLLADDSVCYEIKPRAEGDSNMKLSVGGKPTPNAVIASFLMLPEPCGVKRSADVNTSVLNGNNYWLQSMWLGVDAGVEGKAIFTPKDCIICGGVDKQGQGVARYFVIDFNQRLADIIQLAKNSGLEGEVLSCVKHFADIYSGNKPFVYEESAAAIKAVMKYLSIKYPEQYSGTLDPLSFIQKLSHSCTHPVKQYGPRQKIVYGAPGTGKSHGIEGIVGVHDDTVRTTFHPDSDYATFVGCYKPTMVPQVKYGLQGKPIEEGGKEVTEEVIAYSYVPQAFTKAYVRAWRKMTPGPDGKIAPQFLVIEEINRGNCAQIFGDLFQLLDRDGTHYSKYAIEADSDLAKYIAKELSSASASIPDEIRSGKILKLPPNLYIWATMNTSDQSLFPMDSAFKRRWEWEYIPIKDAGKNWKIVAGGTSFPWWGFIETVNKYILDTLKNEDKQFGYFFVRPDDDASDTIEASKFVNKVLFYLYNDVFKDYDLPKGFAKPDGKGKFAFKDFFLADGKPDEVAVKDLLTGLLVQPQ